MALTHALADRNNPLRHFFEERFPTTALKPVSELWYERVRASSIVCEPPGGVNPGTIGTAFDYRARLCFAPLNWEETVAARGAFNTFGLGRPQLAALGHDVGKELLSASPQRRLGGRGALEERLCQCCYALALYDQLFRAQAARTSSPLLGLPEDASLEDLLALAPGAAIDDIASMTRLLCDREPDLFETRVALNPTFDGSMQVGGADADLISNGTLIELKTTRQEKFERVDHIYQLLGYALLDFSDSFGLSRIGIYLARRGLLLTWELNDLVRLCPKTTDLEQLRAEFRDLVPGLSL